MRWNSRVGATKSSSACSACIRIGDPGRRHPISRAAEFLDFYAREIALWPQWVCPIGPQANCRRFVLYPVKNAWYVNFGFWDVKRTRGPPAGTSTA